MKEGTKSALLEAEGPDSEDQVVSTTVEQPLQHSGETAPETPGLHAEGLKPPSSPRKKRRGVIGIALLS
ncbi:MAG: hypothetical protein ACREDR_28405, partial [Blastocatellia bacterium]